MALTIHHLDGATLRPRGRRLVEGTGGLFEPGTLVCHCLLIETGDGLVLVDTGLGTADLADPTGRLGHLFALSSRPVTDPGRTLAAQVVALGHAIDDVRHIVVTHLDVDHAGGLGDFPGATVHVHADEHAAAMARATFRDRRRYFAIHWAHQPRWALHRPIDRTWRGFGAVLEPAGLPSGIVLVHLPGHTAGHCGVAVETGDGGWLLHAGDAYVDHRQLTDRPYLPIGMALFERFICTDHAAWRATIDDLRRLSGEGDVRLVCTHDAHYLRGSRSARPDRRP